MRGGGGGAFVSMGAHAEAGLGILIDDLADLHVRPAEVQLEEVLVLEGLLDERDDFGSGL